MIDWNDDNCTILSLIRTSILTNRRLNEQKNSEILDDKDRTDRLERTASLALQTCILNSLSLFVSTTCNLSRGLQALFSMAGRNSAADIMAFIYEYGVSGFQAPSAILSSNIGFFVHCYCSLIYREAIFEAFGSVKQKLRKKLPCFFKQVQPNHPVAAHDADKNVRINELWFCDKKLIFNFSIVCRWYMNSPKYNYR